MSQFKLQKVTKVKGPSELSIGEQTTTKKSSRSSTASAASERPQTRQKKTVKSATEEKSSPTSSKSEKTSPSRPPPRSRPTPSKRTTATTTKTCPLQQNKKSGSPQTGSKQARAKGSASGDNITKTQQNKPEVKHSKKPLQSKKNNNNHDSSSGSDSDEHDLSGKLSPKDDIGYETGSFDDIDASSSETTSPSAVDENKSILDKQTAQAANYSYADLEFNSSKGADVGVNSSNERLSYAYAGNEFRPLIITDNGGIAASIETKPNENKQQLQHTSYEEVEIQSGNFDRANLNLAHLMPSPEYENYNNSKESATRSKQQDDELDNSDDSQDVYATVNKDRQKKPKEIEQPPEIPSRKDITRSDLYEHITGELQNMIEACDGDGKKNAPPPLPKPYSGPGIVESFYTTDSVNDEEDNNGVALYAAVQKKPKDKQDKKPVDLPPPLPSRLSNLDDTLKRDTAPIQTSTDKSSGVGIFKKMHRRKFSDGNFINNSGEIFGYPSSSLFKKGHKRSKSQDDITNPNISQQGKTRSDSGTLIEPYLEVDITDPPNTPTDVQPFKGSSDPVDDTLPDGWKEVESENGTRYYWHIASGTTQWEKPQVAPRQKKKSYDQVNPLPEKQKVLSFPVHSMGWIELEENQVAPHNMSDTITECIGNLAKARKDLWQTTETWGEGKDIRLLLEGDTLKLVEPRNKITLLVQPVSKMRVWGVGKDDHRDFAYVARDPNTSKHKCHMFRCHGNISGRAITTALHEMCNRILEEKKRAQEISKKNTQKPWSDIINTPPPPSVKSNVGFNEKPLREQRKDFTATYMGSIDVPKPTGMEMLNRAISKVASRSGPKRTVLIQVTVSCVRITDCTSQEEISEDRVRYLSFMGIGKDERLCGYVMANEPDRQYLCHVFHCTPNAAALTKALEEACQLRYQKCLDAYPEMAAKAASATPEVEQDKTKDKSNFMSSVQGLFAKMGPKKSGTKKDDASSIPGLPKPSHTFMVKYYGALPVAVGTGVETVQEAAKHLTGGTLLICQLDVAINGVTLYDSQRSALSRRHMDADTISYCGLTNDGAHFGLIQCQGGGKYVCHVFSEYKTRANPIVAAIHETL